MALIACLECGDKISSDARRCPTCGAKRPGRFPIETRLVVGGLFAAVAIIVAFIGYAKMDAGPDPDLLSDLAEKKESCQIGIRELESLGIRITRTEAATIAEYDEQYWAAYQHDVRVRQAMLFYCADMPSNGIYTVYIKRAKDRKILASIHNGKYYEGE
jgi:hypothetical protein